jgi:hypothetical protein
MSALAKSREPATVGALTAFVVLAVAVLSSCSSSQSPTTGGAMASPAKSLIPIPPTTASAMIGGIAHGGYNPDFVSCEIRGTVGGMVFHGTLSGPHIGNHKFTVTAGQASNGRTPTTPTDGIFALKFAGQGPIGPFTCSLSSVDTPNGITLAPHSAGDWTLTVA